MSNSNHNPSSAGKLSHEEYRKHELVGKTQSMVDNQQEVLVDRSKVKEYDEQSDRENGWECVSLDDEVTSRFRQGKDTWNKWRSSKGANICLDAESKRYLMGLHSLSGFNLNGMDLSGYDLTNKRMDDVDFSGSLLIGTKFNGSDLRKVKFKRADLTRADFTDTRLSGAILDEGTIYHSIRSNHNVTVGINGFYVRRTKGSIEEHESAALMTLIPAGDSMKGHNSEIVVENLKHARQLHTGSILMVTIVTVILMFPNTPDIQMPVLSIKLPVGTLSIIAMIIAMVDQFLVLNHVRDAADGAKYLQTREDAMKIALFPWGISNYPGKRPGLARDVRQAIVKVNYWWPWFSNELNRIVTCFHTILFIVGGIFYYERCWWKFSNVIIITPQALLIAPLSFKSVLFIFINGILLFFSWLVYKEARRFVLPIVFDAESEKSPKNDLNSLAEHVKEQLQVSKRLASLIETAIPRYPNLVDRFSDRLPDGVDIQMRLIQAGEFYMGSDIYNDEKPIHKVELSQFWMSVYPVTQRVWKAVMGSLPEELEDKAFINPRYPIIYISWSDAVKFCHKLNNMLGLTDEYGYRLPTESEWEYAAKGRTNTDYSFDGGDATLYDYAWFIDNSEAHLQVVGQKLPNLFGLYDMHGNVWEWCQDHYESDYSKAPSDGSAWEDTDLAANRVVRGGCWGNYTVDCRSANRIWFTPGARNNYIGFRLSRTLPSALLPSRRD